MNEKTIYIVTGIPRSGTSLMMQILKKCNFDILTDSIREKDISNPEGYFEYEAVKGIVRDNSFLKLAQGKVVKIVVPLPLYLDKSLNYRVIFMRREIEEVLRSQEKMLNKNQVSEREKFRTIYEIHLNKTYQFFKSNNIEFLDVSYRDLLTNEEEELSKIFKFLNISASIEDTKGTIRQDLYRNKLNSNE